MRSGLDQATNVNVNKVGLLQWAAQVSERWLPLLMFGFTLLSFISTIGRTDFNAAVALFGILFHKTFDATQRSWYMYALATCIFFDLVWLNVAGGVSATIAADGLEYARTQRMVAVGTSVVNLFVKIGLVLFLYVAGLPQQQQQYDAVETSDVVASPASPRSEAAARH